MAAVNKAGAQSYGWLERLVAKVDDLSGGAVGRLLESTALSRPSAKSPWGDWQGVTAVLNRPAAPAPSLTDAMTATLNEIKESVNIVVKSLTPEDGLEALTRKLKDFGLELYDRSGANYLFHQRTKTHHAAVQVNPALSYQSTLLLDLKANLERGLRKHIGNEPLARVYESPEAMAFGMGFAELTQKDLVGENGRQKRILAYTESMEPKKEGGIEKRGWLGYIHAVASGDPDENLQIIAEAKRKGLELVLPERTMGDAKKGKLVRGMPILVKSRMENGRKVPMSMPSDKVSPKMALSFLVSVWGKSMMDTFIAKAEKIDKMGPIPFAPPKKPAAAPAPAPAPTSVQKAHGTKLTAQDLAGLAAPAPARNATVIDFQEAKGDRKNAFLDQFTRKSAPEPTPRNDEVDDIFAEVAQESKRDLRVRVNEGRTEVYIYDGEFDHVVKNPLTDKPLPVSDMPNGRYPLEDHEGKKLGVTHVKDGRVVHRDENNQTLTFAPKGPAPEPRMANEQRGYGR